MSISSQLRRKVYGAPTRKSRKSKWEFWRKESESRTAIRRRAEEMLAQDLERREATRNGKAA